MIGYLKGDQTLTFVNLSINDCRQSKEKLLPIFDALDVLILNTHEYAELVKKPYQSIDFFHLDLEPEILKKRIVVITDAEKGSYGYQNGKFYFQEAIKPEKIVDTTGAGDGYTAGFIADYLKNKDIASAMKNGALYAVKILQKLGAN
jgi:sugar/nucleoside kinase (ribokinase family)